MRGRNRALRLHLENLKNVFNKVSNIGTAAACTSSSSSNLNVSDKCTVSTADKLKSVERGLHIIECGISRLKDVLDSAASDLENEPEDTPPFSILDSLVRQTSDVYDSLE